MPPSPKLISNPYASLKRHLFDLRNKKKIIETKNSKKNCALGLMGHKRQKGPDTG